MDTFSVILVVQLLSLMYAYPNLINVIYIKYLHTYIF